MSSEKIENPCLGNNLDYSTNSSLLNKINMPRNFLIQLFNKLNEEKIKLSDFINDLKKVTLSICQLNKVFYGIYYSEKTGNNKEKHVNSFDNKVLNNKEVFVGYFLNDIPSIFPINDTKRKEVIENEDFIIAFYEFIWTLYKYYAMHTYDLNNGNEFIKNSINRIVKKENYCIINCNPEKADNVVIFKYPYTCGRIILPNHNKNSDSKIIIFNTISSMEGEDFADTDYFKKITGNLTGGYFYKYLKYKQKYLNSKKYI